MECLDIVQSAAYKCGLVSSFNPDEFPGDIEDAGRATLINEILPMLNCDRTLDITVTARTYQPVNGVIVLKPLQPRENSLLIGYSKYNTEELVNHWVAECERLMPSLHDEWPKDDFGQDITIMIWSTDTQIVFGTSNSVDIMPDVNIDFPPMRIDEVLDEGSRIKYEYVYRSEFERILRVALPGVYTTEEYEDKIVILINGTNEAKRLILPVPLQVVNVRHDYAGDIIAPPKFRRYLIDATAVSLAITYGLSTVDAMKAEAAQSYQMLKKNKTQPMHRANVSEEINQTLRHGQQGRRFYAGF